MRLCDMRPMYLRVVGPGSHSQIMSINSTTFIAISFIISLALVGFNISASLNSSIHAQNNVASSEIASLVDEVQKLKKLVRGGSRNEPTSVVRGLVVPEGPAVAKPSVGTTEEEEASIKRKFYGGRGDKPHLGGFTSFDPNGISPTLWKEMVEWIGIKSLVDVGCGRGISTSWFILHGLDYVVCVEGSHDAVTNSLLPGLKPRKETEFDLVEHDFSLGPWW